MLEHRVMHATVSLVPHYSIQKDFKFMNRIL